MTSDVVPGAAGAGAVDDSGPPTQPGVRRVPAVTAPPPLNPSDSVGVTAAAPAPAVAAPREAGVRRARLMVTRLDPWSVLKTTFMLSIAFGIVVLVAVAILWWILSQLSVFDALSRTVNDIAGSGTTQFDLKSVLSFGRVMGLTLVLAAFQIVLFSVLATLFAFLYNLAVGISGGLEVTLAEES